MVSAEFEGTCTMMQSAGAGDPLSPEASYLRSMAYPHPESTGLPPHPHHPQMQVLKARLPYLLYKAPMQRLAHHQKATLISGLQMPIGTVDICLETFSMVSQSC